MSHDPIRFVDDERLSSELRADLRACSGPTGGYDMDAGLGRLTASIAAGALAGTAAAHAGVASTVKASGLSLLAKIVSCVAVAGVVGGGIAFVASEARSSRTAPPRPSASAAGASEPVAVETAAAEMGAPRAWVSSGPSETVSSEGIEPIPSSSSEALRSATVETPATEASSAAVRTLPKSDASAANSASASPSTQVEPSIVKEEIAFMADLRKKARLDPAGAAALADEGQARFPRGLFWQDRESMAVEALMQLGKQEEARRRARAFLSSHPESPFAERIQRVTGVGSSDDAHTR